MRTRFWLAVRRHDGILRFLHNGLTVVVHENFNEMMQSVTQLQRPTGYRIRCLQFLHQNIITDLTAENYNFLQENQIVTVVVETGDSLGALYESLHNRLSNLELRLGTATNGL